jgi:hypothetical protein
MTTCDNTSNEKSESFSSLKSRESVEGCSSVPPTTRPTRVCFAMDYNTPHDVYAADPNPLSEDEIQDCFYSVRKTGRVKL